jgi:hypothetical protein
VHGDDAAVMHVGDHADGDGDAVLRLLSLLLGGADDGDGAVLPLP